MNKDKKELEVKHESLFEIFKVFLKLGFTAFGGPAAHIALMEEELVSKRKWTDRQQFMDIIGLTNLLPGPNSTEVAIMMGYLRGGPLGLIIAGISFIGPAMLIVMLLAGIYVSYGALPELNGIMYGIKPVILAIILTALIKFFKTAVKGNKDAVFAITAIVLAFTKINEILLLLGFGLLYLIMHFLENGNKNGDKEIAEGLGKNKGLKLKLMIPPYVPLLLGTMAAGARSGAYELFRIFLKIGSVLYGSGYVLLAFIEREFVTTRGILTLKELMDSVAIGQFTPGPVFTTATFIGYILGGIEGSIGATIGIFLPSFVLVWLLKPILFKMRDSKILRSVLNGVNISSLGLMVSVTFVLGRNSITDVFTIAVFLISFLILLKTKLNSVWLITLGAVLGYIFSMA